MQFSHLRGRRLYWLRLLCSPVSNFPPTWVWQLCQLQGSQGQETGSGAVKQTFKMLWDPDFLTSLWGFNQFLPSTCFLARAWTDAMEQKGSYLSFPCKHSFLVFFLFSLLSYYLNFVNSILAVLFKTVKIKKSKWELEMVQWLGEQAALAEDLKFSSVPSIYTRALTIACDSSPGDTAPLLT